MAPKWLDALLGPKSVARATPSQRRVPASAAKSAAAPRLNTYQAVGIVPCSKACKPAREARDTKFLARQAPRLPLQACEHPESCTCRFEKYVDRRAGSQRAPYQDTRSVSYAAQEKRKVKGRRADDR